MSNYLLLKNLTAGTLLFASQALALEPLKSATESLAAKGVSRHLNQFDLNKDGKIAKSESEVFWKKRGKSDTDKDGFLDKKELAANYSHNMGSPGKQMLNVLYKQTPQGGVYLDIFYPDTDDSTEKPVLFFTHGGGWAAGNKSKAVQAAFKVVHKAWLKEGFTVVSIGYRLVKKDQVTNMRDCVIDCKDAMRFISGHKQELGISPDKFYTFGDSAGGHLAMMLLYCDAKILLGDEALQKYSYKTVAGVSWYGPCDFQDLQLFNHDDRPGFRDRFGPRILPKGSLPEQKPKLYKEMSPVTYLTKESPPLLMIQGDKDTTIPVKQAYRMKEALKTIQAPVEFLIIENAGHNWRSVGAPIKPSRAEISSATIEFIKKHKK